MTKSKPYADEPGRYCTKKTGDGWFVMLDYALRLKVGGSALHRILEDGSKIVNESPWVIWHPATGTLIGFSSRRLAKRVFDEVIRGVDVQGMLSMIRGKPVAARSFNDFPQVAPFPGQEENGCASPAHTRAREDHPAGFMQQLQDAFPPDILCEHLADAMTANEVSYIDGVMHFHPDWRTRFKGLELTIAYLVGRPVERQQVIQAKAPESWDSLMDLARCSPVFRDTLLGMLREIERSGPAETAQPA